MSIDSIQQSSHNFESELLNSFVRWKNVVSVEISIKLEFKIENYMTIVDEL